MGTPDSWRVVCQDLGDGSGEVIVSFHLSYLRSLVGFWEMN